MHLARYSRFLHSVPSTVRTLVPLPIRESIGFALTYSSCVGRSPISVFVDGLSATGRATLREDVLSHLQKHASFPRLELDPRTDPGAVREVLINREYDQPGFVPDAKWIVLDVGAQHGEFSLLSSHVRGARVIAFEPMAENISVFEANIRLNQSSRISVFPIALGQSDSTVEGRVYGGMFLKKQPGAPHRRQTVTQRRLDSLALPEAARAHPVLLKIDVEGFELDVLAGAKEFISAIRPMILIEASAVTRRDVLQAWMSASGYELAYELSKQGTSILFLRPEPSL